MHYIPLDRLPRTPPCKSHSCPEQEEDTNCYRCAAKDFESNELAIHGIDKTSSRECAGQDQDSQQPVQRPRPHSYVFDVTVHSR